MTFDMNLGEYSTRQMRMAFELIDWTKFDKQTTRLDKNGDTAQ